MELSGFVDSLQSAEHGFSGCEENNKILGYIGMYLSIDEGEITNVAVSPKCGAMALAACCLRKQRGREPLGRQNRARSPLFE